jgi:hypothetical protein
MLHVQESRSWSFYATGDNFLNTLNTCLKNQGLNHNWCLPYWIPPHMFWEGPQLLAQYLDVSVTLHYCGVKGR